MTQHDLQKFIHDFQSDQRDLLDSKGADYSRDHDRLSNFKSAGAGIDLPPLAVWYIFAKKHLDAIAAYVRTGTAASEEIMGRFADLGNYAILGAALVKEKEQATK